MKRFTIVTTAALVVAATGLTLTAQGGRKFKEFLNGFKEATTVISTTGNGTFQATISDDESEINYVLTFKDLRRRGETGAHPHWTSTEPRGDRPLAV